MQALHGEASAQDGDGAESNITNLRGLKGCLLALQELKVNAWRSEKSKGQKDAMLEYVEFVTSIAPQWSLAAMLLGAEGAGKPRHRGDGAIERQWQLRTSRLRHRTLRAKVPRHCSTGLSGAVPPARHWPHLHLGHHSQQLVAAAQLCGGRARPLIAHSVLDTPH